MPEPAAWRYQKITKPMFDTPFAEVTLAGRIIPMTGGVIENGHVTLSGGKITSVGEGAPSGAHQTGGTIMPGMINSHAHLNWDGIHDLARQSMDDPKPISAFKAAGNMLKSLRAGHHDGPGSGLPRHEPLLQTGRRAGHLPRPAPQGLRQRHHPDRRAHLLGLQRGVRGR
jgi:imidazolonepropionase-like amidohydrolase